MSSTSQEKFWESSFGQEYTDRNHKKPAELDQMYKEIFGVTRSEINNEFLSGLSLDKILEVGCNSADQLNMLQHQGHDNLYGLEVQEYAFEVAKNATKNISLVRGSAFDLPFKDSYFDLVFTSGVLIHIHPDDLPKAMAEIVRTSKKYIWGYEFFNDDMVEIEYRGNDDKHWKGDYAQKYLDLFPELKLVKEKKYKYLENENMNQVFLLEKVN